jgi:nucleoside 2-deoxyribosyltransferase
MSVKCFVIMPFREGFERVYETVRAAAANSLPAQTIECYWLKDVHHAGRITDDIVTGLQESSLCIADVTSNNPNVMWETGYAMALRKPTILIGQEVEQLPFDLKDHRILAYSLGRLEDMASTLAESVRQTMARYDIAVPSESDRPLGPVSQTIAVTGTMRAHPARAKRRVVSVLQPYLSEKTLWYCGSVGEVDECAMDYMRPGGFRGRRC